MRYYSASTSKHFYSTGNVVPSGYVSEGILLYVYDHQVTAFTEPIFVLMNNGDTLLTTSVVEKNNAISAGFTDKGIIGYTNNSPELTKIYRYWRSSKSDHLYTNNYNELGSGKFSYRYEDTLLW